MIKIESNRGWAAVDDNVWEYPFGDLDDDDDLFMHKPEIEGGRMKGL
jgi:hypothetical protein